VLGLYQTVELSGNEETVLDYCFERFGQTPDCPATHAAVATVAPFPAWRGSQGLRCAEPGI